VFDYPFLDNPIRSIERPEIVIEPRVLKARLS
jgi:hypothetical protein